MNKQDWEILDIMDKYLMHKSLTKNVGTFNC